jgi:hypothetical protein
MAPQAARAAQPPGGHTARFQVQLLLVVRFRFCSISSLSLCLVLCICEPHCPVPSSPSACGACLLFCSFSSRFFLPLFAVTFVFVCVSLGVWKPRWRDPSSSLAFVRCFRSFRFFVFFCAQTRSEFSVLASFSLSRSKSELSCFALSFCFFSLCTQG